MKIKKGISSVSISLRVDGEVALFFDKRAKELGFPTVEAYLKSQIMKSYIAYNTKSAVSVQPKIPLYNPMKHKAGDTVIKNGKVVVIPELDADGRTIPW